MAIQVLYDGGCRFCRVATAMLLAWDRRGRLEAMPLQDPRAGELLGRMSMRERLGAVRVIDDGGRLHSGGHALPVLFDELPAGEPMAWLARRVQPLTDRAYKAVDEMRPSLNKVLPERLALAADRLIARKG